MVLIFSVFYKLLEFLEKFFRVSMNTKAEIPNIRIIFDLEAMKMSEQYSNEPLLDMFLFETTQLIEQLEQTVLRNEQDNNCFNQDAINEIFRIMHTIKGSAAMMMFSNIATLAHKMEDIFYYLREEKPEILDFSGLSDIVLDGIDFIKCEIDKIKNSKNADGDSTSLIHTMNQFLVILKENNKLDKHKDAIENSISKDQKVLDQNQVSDNNYSNNFRAIIYFEEGCEMENIRAYTVIRNLSTISDHILYVPDNIIDNDDATEIIRREGFHIYLKSDYTYEMMNDFLMQTIFLKLLELRQIDNEEDFQSFYEKGKIRLEGQENRTSENIEPKKPEQNSIDKKELTSVQSIISVNVNKLDKLMDLVGEMVIAEAMVIQNPDLLGLELNNFRKATRQLNKITTEMQDLVMSIRMVPLSATFSKMNRIVRDMNKKTGKDVKLEIIGGDTEVDKNIIEHISDPLMHLVRNCIDHGIEPSNERIRKGKPQTGIVTLEAKNSGGDVLILVKDDGKGLDRDKILNKAKENRLLKKDEKDMTDQELFNLILQPGFSTNVEITEFSGRGVGMDVVAKNIDVVGGSLSIESIPDKGTQFRIRIPLTLAIIDGMNIKVGNSYFILPTISIKQSFRPKEEDIFFDTDNNEMIMVRGQCYPIIKLHERFGIETKITKLSDGILIMVEHAEQTVCVLADELLGQQQVVVKALPEYIKKFRKVRDLSGCTLLGDGSISLIIDVAGLISL
jgi:two-component system chemotaxis sensor kinase CheA